MEMSWFRSYHYHTEAWPKDGLSKSKKQKRYLYIKMLSKGEIMCTIWTIWSIEGKCTYIYLLTWYDLVLIQVISEAERCEWHFYDSILLLLKDVEGTMPVPLSLASRSNASEQYLDTGRHWISQLVFSGHSPKHKLEKKKGRRHCLVFSGPTPLCRPAEGIGGAYGRDGPVIPREMVFHDEGRHFIDFRPPIFTPLG